MGTAVMGGTLTASLIAVFLIPVAFYVVMTLSRKREKHKQPESEGEKNA
jgi:hypothetical protein